MPMGWSNLGKLALASVLGGGLLAAQPVFAADNDSMTRDLLLLTDWFEGRFDNEEQRWFQEMEGYKGRTSEEFVRIHTMHKRVDLPQFGEHVFYVEEYRDSDPSQIIRQRLVIFSTDGETRQVRMQQGFFKSPTAYAGGYQEPDKLADLTPEDVSFIDTCDVTWKRVASQFEGSMAPKACVFGEGEDRRYSVHDMWLSPDKYWRVDATFRVSDDSHFAGAQRDKPYEMRRALPFNCSFYFFANNQFEGQVIEGLSLHSQGGTVTATRDSDGKAYEIFMREKEYDYYETRPDFIYFALREKGETRSVAFSVNDPDARTVGVRAESIGAFCHRDGYTFRQPLELLEDY